MLRFATFAICAAAIGFTTPLGVADEPLKKIEMGQAAPDFIVTGIDGKPFKLSDKLKSEKQNVVLIFSRANW